MLDSPSGPALATHILAMIADQNVFEVSRNAANDGFVLVPSMERAGAQLPARVRAGAGQRDSGPCPWHLRPAGRAAAQTELGLAVLPSLMGGKQVEYRPHV